MIRHISNSNSEKNKSTSISLVELDDFVWNRYIIAVNARERKHIILSDLSMIMKWKLTTGRDVVVVHMYYCVPTSCYNLAIYNVTSIMSQVNSDHYRSS